MFAIKTSKFTVTLADPAQQKSGLIALTVGNRRDSCYNV
ncbi:hypothetical protein UYSO10_1627 [Kosakonia radicincitans]|nr:hypothetical protein UYSO10_1627 [Kosakonia radicincitans]